MVFTRNPAGRQGSGKNPDKWQWANICPRANQADVPDMRNYMSGSQAHPQSVCPSSLNVARLMYNDVCYIQDHPRTVPYVWDPMISEWNQADRSDIPASRQCMARTIQSLQLTAVFQLNWLNTSLNKVTDFWKLSKNRSQAKWHVPWPFLRALHQHLVTIGIKKLPTSTGIRNILSPMDLW